ncbi:enoyl-CoA hydratase/isomerase family protein [Halalkalicoccus jeotgali]|uniref:3-hydroxybutyryl-CoA dehydratase n=1 Tax=Halalkalicoccus jeotgali (strain DSM 18796 / CECT 7217 / JCM 14584 / KCTC 4019 / B3) TaxID=795797 RepID=D8JCV9_HALJB|nr:enoyl-CoA hydratase-related protein [Halalkalicoccus jeotgali]ADJ16854.1 3-hydroxybutyryl-CoA dehydratase [Halalkalicoccus jeotgali B3]ELY38710.1 3-hydroxybutyryl-CoA dehydratase [Halalkalicoccus jeotgali B3]
MADRVLIERENDIATIIVNRPEKRNAMDIPTRKALYAAFEEVSEDDDVRAIVLRGAGDGSFIAGGDIDSFADFDHMDGMEYSEKYAQGLYNYVADRHKPTIAAVDGYALGGGTEIALACDIRLATDDAKFGLPEVGIGVIPAGGGTQRLVQVVGAGLASELILTGRIISADEAKRIGLANHVYAAEEFDNEVRAMAEDLASKAPVAQRLAKESIRRSLDIDAGLEYERLAGAFLFGTDDQKEGANAFLEDREPKYRNR